MHAFAEALNHTPGGKTLVVVAIIASLIELLCVVLAASALREIRRARTPYSRLALRARALLTLAGLALVPMVAIWSCEQARAMFVTAIHGPAAQIAERSGAMAEGLAGTVNAVALGFGLALGPPLFLGSLACSLLLAAAWNREELENASARVSSWWPIGVVALIWAIQGVYRFALAALKHSIQYMKGFGQAANAPPGEKEALLVKAMDAAAAPFETWHKASLILIAVVCAVAVVLLMFRSASERRDRTRGWGPGIACLLLALIVHRLTAPYRVENENPIPFTSGSDAVLPRLQVKLPLLEGPDKLQIAPVLQVDAERATLDGGPSDPEALASDLIILRRNWAILHPGATFPGYLAVACAARTPMKRLQPLLEAARWSGYDHLQLVLGESRMLERPVLGKIERAYYSSAMVISTVSDEQPGDAVNVASDSLPLYDDVARAVVNARKSGSEARLSLR